MPPKGRSLQSTTESRLRQLRSVAAAFLFLLFSLQLLHVARLYSATWDEAHHLYDGYNIWTHSDYRLNAEVPPFVKLIAALPLLPMHLIRPPDAHASQAAEAFLDGRAFVFGNGGDRVLLPARLAVTVFPLLLAWLVYVAASRMFGAAAAAIALLLFTFDPNVLAFGTLVTTDVGSACCFFAAVFAFYRYARAPHWGWVALTALAAGLTFVAKFTGILLLPMLLLLACAEGVRARSAAIAARRLAACCVIFLCGWAILWAFYGFRYAPARDGLALSPAFATYIQSIPGHRGTAALAFAARVHLLPQAYLWGLANTKITEWEYTSYFFGHIYRHGPWQYFPAAFLIKSTLPLLLLLLLCPLLLFHQWRQHSRELVFLLVPVCVYGLVVITSHFDIGVRHLLPIYPFLYVLAAATAAAALRRRRPLWTALVVILLAWQVVTTVRVAPDFVAYGNEAWGGPSAVHRYLSDANVDWGQQLKTVKQYLDTNHITHCWFAYFPDGAVAPEDYGVHCHRLPTGTSLFWLKMPMQVPPVIDGTVLISDSDLEGVEFGDRQLNPYDSFRALRPVALLQHGVAVYQGQFAVPLAAALVDVRRTGELKATGDLAGALRVAQAAAALAPGSATVQLNLADMLGAAGDWKPALDHYVLADSLARRIRPELEEDLLAPIAAGEAAARGHL